MLKELIKLANHLDSKGLRKEADHLDRIVVKLAQSVHPGGDLIHIVKAEQIKSFSHADSILSDIEVVGGTLPGYGPPFTLKQGAQEQFTEVLKYLGKNADNIAKSKQEEVIVYLRERLGRIKTPNNQQKETAISIGDAIYNLFFKYNSGF